MAFRPLGEAPGRDRVCDEVKSLLLKAFPAKVLETHFQAGYSFRSDGCTSAFAYDPDYCVAPGDVKMDPDGFGPERDAVVGMIQSAFNCSPVGETLEALRQIAKDTLDNNLWRAIEADLVGDLAAFPGLVPAAGELEAKCALSEAAQFLATNGNCGKGIIVGPYDWFVQLGTDHLVWNGTYHTDVVGNIVIPLSVDNNTVYAFDSNVDIRVAEMIVLDELSPSIRSVNDRVVRAEQIYTIAIDPCVVGAFTVSDCCPCGGGGGGGGGGGNVTVTNFPANQDVTVTNPITIANFPADSDFDFEELLLCDDNGTFIHRSQYNAETGVFVAATNTTLTGAPYIPVGTVKACGSGDCCPINIGEGCTNVGSGTYVSIRNSDGSITLIDPITGSPVTQADIVPCSSTPITASLHKDVLPGDPWTPADVTGTLTSVTYTILTGTATVTDSAGTAIAALPQGLSATWENDIEQALTGIPQSIAADPGGRVYVNWTEV